MSSQFIHTLDNNIIINESTFTLSAFLLFEPGYTLAAPYTRRQYEVGVSHIVLSDVTNTFNSLPIPWAEGDLYISRLPTYLAGGNTARLQQYITSYTNLLTHLGFSDLNELEFPLVNYINLVSEALSLSILERITLEQSYPAFTELDPIKVDTALRNYIHSELLKSDWTQLGDSSLTAPALQAWNDYRQALRDIRNGTYTTISTVIFPTISLDPRERMN